MMNKVTGLIGALGVIASVYITVASKAFASQPNRVGLLLAVAAMTTLGLLSTIAAARTARPGAWGLLICGVAGILAWPYQLAGLLLLCAAGTAFFARIKPDGTRTAEPVQRT